MAATNGVHPEDVMDTTEDNPVREEPPITSTGPAIHVHEPEKADEDMREDVNAKPPEVVVGIRRNANGTIGSVFSGNKTRHLKKEDGQPLWRKDIQHDFLRYIFEDQTKCFTDVDGSPDKTFAEVFIGAMQRSSKTSKVLKEKLLNEKEQAIRMAMICLLVNIGRMNTTLNFFPEMRAQLRTYHAIPCLQADQDPNAQYKGLQDAPRLKSILKGACEDTEEPRTLDKVKASTIPRTNIVNLIFVLSQDVQKVSDLHFEGKQDLFDLVVQAEVSSKSRATAFLWLMWWYMQSNYTKEDALNNPFGPGQYPQNGPNGIPMKVPELIMLTDEEASAENVDTEEELAFGEEMRLQRKRILEDEDTLSHTVKKTAGPSPARSEVGRTRENTPDGTPSTTRPKKSNLDVSIGEKTVSGIRLNLKASHFDRTGDAGSPAPAGFANAIPSALAPLGKRSRPETSHQKAVSLNRRMHIDKILFKKWKTDTRPFRRNRKENGLSPLYQQIKRVYYLKDTYDSEDEDAIGPGGATPNTTSKDYTEADDFGGHAYHHKKVLLRSIRRLARDDGITLHTYDFLRPAKPQQVNGTKATGRARRGPNAKKAGQSAAKVTQETEAEAEAEVEAEAEGEGEGDGEAEAEDLDGLDADLLGEAHDETLLTSAESDDAELTEDDFSYADPYATVK